jgi:Flp pilus assembly protein CpaB
MTYRLRNIFIAIGLALVAMMLTLFYVTNYKRSVQKGASSVQVYVAARDIQAGVTGQELVKQHALKIDTVRRTDVVPGAISDPEQVGSLVLSTPLYAGEQVTLRRFSDVAAQGIRSQLKGTMRAIQISGDANQLLAGTLQPGDHVDLVANLHLPGNPPPNVDRIVLRDLTVLTSPSDTAKLSAGTGTNQSVIVAVNDTQVQRLFFALHNADWSFELRPVVNAADSHERIDTLETILKEGR